MRSNKEIVKIMDERRTEMNLSISELARRVDMAKSAVSRYFNFSREFPLNRINDFARVLGLEPEYILGFEENDNLDITTTFNQLNKDRQQKVVSFAEVQLKEQKSNVVDMRKWKDVYIQSKVSAGRGIVDLDQQHKELISYDGYVPSKYDLAFQVEGNSMEPMFRDGEVIFVEHQEEVRNGQLGVVTINDEAYIKKIYLEDDCLRLVSLNKEYDDIIADGEDTIKVVGKVIL